MAHYDLQPHEAMILTSENCRHGNTNGELVLTNTDLIYITSKGMFKTTYIPQRFPVRNIKVFNGKAQAIAGKDGVMNVYFTNGQETFKFWNSDSLFSDKKAEKEAAKWVDAITRLVAGEGSGAIVSGSTAVTGAELLSESLKDTFDAAKGILGIKPKSNTAAPPPTKAAGKCAYCGAPLVGMKGQVARCQYCDADQQL